MKDLLEVEEEDFNKLKNILWNEEEEEEVVTTKRVDSKRFIR